MKPSWHRQYITRSNEIRRIIQEGVRKGNRHFTVFFGRNTLPYCRFGTIVQRRWGKAVQRNRARRVLREILRTSLHELVTGMDILVLPRGNLQMDDFQSVRGELLNLLECLGLVKSKNTT